MIGGYILAAGVGFLVGAFFGMLLTALMIAASDREGD